jgi:hypothetical protein
MNLDQANLSQRVRVPQIVTVAMLASSLIYLFLANQAVQNRSADQTLPPSLEHPLALILGVVSLILLLNALLVPPMIVKLSLKSKPNPVLNDYLRALFIVFIMRLAAVETIAIFGLIVGQGSSDLTFSYMTAAVVLAGFGLLFPTADGFAQQLKALASKQPLQPI